LDTFFPANMEAFTRFYFAVSKPAKNLASLEETTFGNVELLRPAEIAHLAVQYGLARWVIDKAR
jgi:hypothetical protein